MWRTWQEQNPEKKRKVRNIRSLFDIVGGGKEQWTATAKTSASGIFGRVNKKKGSYRAKYWGQVGRSNLKGKQGHPRSHQKSEVQSLTDEA